MNQEVLKEAVHDEVFRTQKVFRTILDAMSRPGNVYTLETHEFTHCPGGLNPYAVSILKTLGDNHISFCLYGFDDPAHAQERYIRINTGMDRVDMDKADYVVANGKASNLCLESLNQGTLEFPENSATVIMTADRLEANTRAEFIQDCTQIVMKGPGIKDACLLNMKGIDKKHMESIAKTNSLFPLGLDIILLDESGRIACIPRTSAVEVV